MSLENSPVAKRIMIIKKPGIKFLAFVHIIFSLNPSANRIQKLPLFLGQRTNAVQMNFFQQHIHTLLFLFQVAFYRLSRLLFRLDHGDFRSMTSPIDRPVWASPSYEYTLSCCTMKLQLSACLGA